VEVRTGVALAVSDLQKKFYKRHRPPVQAVDHISFQVEYGKIVGLLGPNGAGKTTTIKCILGLMEPDGGEIKICGYDARRQRLAAMSQVAAVLEGARNIYWRMSVWENLEYFAGLAGVSSREGAPYFRQLLQRFQLEDKKDTPVMELSQGNKQKVAVACALAKRTPLVFLDEPTLGLDVETSYQLREAIKDLVREEGRTIVMSSHDMAVVQDVCERVIIVTNGHIIADDLVANLLALFRTREYRVQLAGSLSSEGRETILTEFPKATIAGDGHDASVRVQLMNGQDIYRLVDTMRRAGADIASITQEEPDLERAFVELVRKERANGHG